MNYPLSYFIKYYIKHPIEFYSKIKGYIFLYYLRFVYKFRKKKLNIREINNISCAYYYLNDKYKYLLDNLPKYKEVSDRENIIWRCWLQGEENAPKLNKSCLSSIRKYVKNKKIVVLTNENINDYVKFPEYIMKKYKKGIISRTHFSDILRCELLIKYG